MSQPESNQNESSKMKKLLNGGSSETGASALSRLPRKTGGENPPKEAPAPKKEQEVRKSLPAAAKPVSKTTESASTNQSAYPGPRYLPTFWTIASVISMLVNVGVVIVLIVAIQVLGGTRAALDFAQSQANGLLGGLHENFVKMDEASIKTSIHVEKNIPVQFTLNVSGNTNVTLSQDVSINGALVTVNTGGLNINNARANIVLPAGTVLPIFIDNLVVPVDKEVPAILDVPVDIPLNQTELHEPFVGLQQVVQPYYCLLKSEVFVNGVDVCLTTPSVLPISLPGNTTP